MSPLGQQNGTTVQDGIVVHSIQSSGCRIDLRYADSRRAFHRPSDREVQPHLRRLVHCFRPDLVRAHDWLVASFPLATAALVLTSHDYAVPCPKRTVMWSYRPLCSGSRLTLFTPCGSSQYEPVKAALRDGAARIGRPTGRPGIHVAAGPAAAPIGTFAHNGPVIVAGHLPADSTRRPDVGGDRLPNDPFTLSAGPTGTQKGTDLVFWAWAGGPAPLPLAIAPPDVGGTDWPDNVAVISLDNLPVTSTLRQAMVPSIWPEPCQTTVLKEMTLVVPVPAGISGDHHRRHRVPFGPTPADPRALIDSVRDTVINSLPREAVSSAPRARAAGYSVAAVGVPKDALDLFYPLAAVADPSSAAPYDATSSLNLIGRRLKGSKQVDPAISTTPPLARGARPLLLGAGPRPSYLKEFATTLWLQSPAAFLGLLESPRVRPWRCAVLVRLTPSAHRSFRSALLKSVSARAIVVTTGSPASREPDRSVSDPPHYPSSSLSPTKLALRHRPPRFGPS